MAINERRRTCEGRDCTQRPNISTNWSRSTLSFRGRLENNKLYSEVYTSNPIFKPYYISYSDFMTSFLSGSVKNQKNILQCQCNAISFPEKIKIQSTKVLDYYISNEDTWQL